MVYLTEEELLRKRIEENMKKQAAYKEFEKAANTMNMSGAKDVYDYMQKYNLQSLSDVTGHINTSQPSVLSDEEILKRMAANQAENRAEYYGVMSGQQLPPSPSVTQTQPVQQQYTAPVQQTQYKSPYQEQVDAILNEILNYKPFTYDVQNDPMYQAYKKRYQQAGEESFQNTIGDLTGMTGGRLNTWATSAASQARGAWDEKLMDVVPELYNLAYEMYSNELANKYNQLSAVGGLEAKDYERYRDVIGDTRYQQELAYKQLQDKLAQEQYAKEWEYGVGRDKLADERYQQEWLNQLGKQQKEEERYEREWQYMLSQDEYNKLTQEEKTDYDRYWQDKMWDYQVTQDEYEKMTKAEQQAYDRAWQKKMFEYGVTQDELNRAETKEEKEYQRYLDSLKFKQEEPPTASQLANYNEVLQGLLSEFDNPVDALKHVNRFGKQQYIDLMGESLYNQLMQDLQEGFERDDYPALYVEMINSDDPEKWLYENQPWLDPEEFRELKKDLEEYYDNITYNKWLNRGSK